MNSQARVFPAAVIFTRVVTGNDKSGVKNLLKLTLFLRELCKQTQAILSSMLMTNISLTL